MENSADMRHAIPNTKKPTKVGQLRNAVLKLYAGRSSDPIANKAQKTKVALCRSMMDTVQICIPFRNVVSMRNYRSYIPYSYMPYSNTHICTYIYIYV